MNTQQFVNRHISMSEKDKSEMLQKIGVGSVEELISQTIPQQIRLNKDLDISPALSEYEMLQHSKALAAKCTIIQLYRFRIP
jgi:glycine dehydrogenase